MTDSGFQSEYLGVSFKAKGPGGIRFAIAAAFAVAPVVLRPALAAEYCVTCAGPAAMYACAVEGDAADAPINPRMQLLCIQELARQGGHETCSVPRSAPQPCPGVMRMVAAPADVAPIPSAAQPANAGPAAAPSPGEGQEAAQEPAPAPEADAGNIPAAGGKKKEPRTVEELAAQTVEASKKGLQKAGDAVTGTAEKAGDKVGEAGSAVGTAAKKTWHCLSSFFSEC